MEQVNSVATGDVGVSPAANAYSYFFTHQMLYSPRLFAESKNKSYICSGIALNDKMPMNVTIINNIRQYFMTQPVKKAWLFGSFSRGEETADSDVDILVEFDRSGKPVTLLTYARIWRELEERLGRDVDLVEEGTLKPYALESANHDKRLIYERDN